MPKELRAAVTNVPNATVELLEGADHGFDVLKFSGRTQQDVWSEASEIMLSWLRSQPD